MMNSWAQSEVFQSDVLVLGGGIAGCFAAINARNSGVDVLMVDKGSLGRSGLSHQMSGILSYFDPEKDDHDKWYRECVETSLWLADQHRLEGMINETTDRIRDLESWGAEFQQTDGEFIRKAGVGQQHGRNVIMTNGGFQLMSVLRGEVLRRGVRLLERVMATDLLTSDGKLPTDGAVTGAVGFNIRNGKRFVFQTRAVVIATGSTLAILPRMAMYSLSGDGKAMSFRAGAEMRNVELAYYGLRPRDFNTAPGANILFGEGSTLINAKGERFMKKWDPRRMERASRTVTGRAITAEMLEGRGPVFLDATQLDDAAHRRIAQAIPILVRSFALSGLTLRKDPIPYDVTLMDLGAGGIRVDREGLTTIPGLYGAGAASDHGEDGVTNIISHGMEAAIGGDRAGGSAARYASGASGQPTDEHQVLSLGEKAFAPLKREGGLSRQEVRTLCIKILEQGLLGPIRNDDGLKAAIEALEEIKERAIPRLMAKDYHDLAGAIGVENGVLFLELLGRCARVRTESRGPHFRADHPETDGRNWLKWVVAKKVGEEIRVREEPIPFKEYPLQPKGAEA